MIKHVRPGEKIRPRAGDQNIIIDSANDWMRRSRGETGGGPISALRTDNTRIMVRNNSDADVDRFSVLALGEPLITATDRLQQFQNLPTFNVAPASWDDIGNFCVTTMPLRAHQVGTAVLVGVTVCRVEMRSEAHRFADIIPGVTDRLGSSAFGLASILWVQAPGDRTGTVGWAYVRLGSDGANDEVLCRLALAGGSAGDTTTKCSFTYDLHQAVSGTLSTDTELVDDDGTHATARSPLNDRANFGAYQSAQAAADGYLYGRAFKDTNGVWTLSIAYGEQPIAEECTDGG